jgi:hypothetical protein
MQSSNDHICPCNKTVDPEREHSRTFNGKSTCYQIGSSLFRIAKTTVLIAFLLDPVSSSKYEENNFNGNQSLSVQSGSPHNTTAEN